jgi:exportin-T
VRNGNPSVRSRVFYLFYRFIKESRNDIPVEIAVSVIDSIRDLLHVFVNIPELESEAPTQQEILDEAMANPGIFDSQLYLFETVGILLSLLFKAHEQQSTLLLAIAKPLLDELSINLQIVTKGSQDVLPILKVHHVIVAVGSVVKGFPDYPSPLPEGYILPPLNVFGQIAEAILVCLEAMNVFKVVRDAVSYTVTIVVFATSSIIR